MNRRLAVGALTVASLLAGGGCSSGGSKVSDATSAPSPTSVSSRTGTQDATSSGPPSTSVSGVGTYQSGDAHVGVVINDITQIFPATLEWRGGQLHVKGTPDAQGQFSAVAPGMTLTASTPAEPVRIAWLGDRGVVSISQWPRCPGQCAPQTAPAGARYVVVQAQNAGRFEVSDGASVQVQLTKVNVPANMRRGLATSTQVPGGGR